MTALTVALDAELAKDRALIFGAVEINMPGGDVRLLDGSAFLTFNGNSFTGEDAVFGALESIEDFTDGTGDEAPGLVISLLPNKDAAPGDVSDKSMQGSRVRLWIGAVTAATGAVIADPLLLFDGEVDVPIWKPGETTRSVEYECVGGMERLFEAEEGIRLAAAFHEAIWPGEEGLRAVTGVQDNVFWGQVVPQSGVTNA